MVKEIPNLDEFKKELADAGEKLVVVDFFATWCGPCKMIAPIIETLAGEKTNVVFLKVDVDKAEDVAAEYGISAMPTLLYFKNGVKVDEVVGANEGKIKEAVEKNQ